MARDYIEQVGDAYRIVGTRVSLDSVAHRFREALSPENIAECFPALTLEQVRAAIAYYRAKSSCR
jgi:uncharacterized protein (DUF433 family)